MLSAALVLLCLAVVTLGQSVVNINDYVDKQMAWHNRLLTPKYGLTQIGGYKIGDVELSSGVQVGMNSLYRTGDCTSKQLSSESQKYVYRIGYRLLLLAFGDIIIKGVSSSGYLRVKENSMLIDYTIFKNQTHCNVCLGEYGFTDFDDVEFGSSDPELDGEDIDELVNGSLVDLVNQTLDRKSFEQHLQALCPRKESQADSSA